MRKGTSELNQIPNEFHEGGAPELPPLPDEFNRFAPTQEGKRRDSKRLMKILLILAAAGIVLLGALKPSVGMVSTAEAEPASPDIEASIPTLIPDAPVPDRTPEQTQKPTETPKPTEAPTPEPEPLPDCEVYYFFTHSVANAIVRLTDPAHTTAVHVKVWDDLVKDSALEYDFTEEDIRNGVWEFDGIDMNDFFGKHLEEYEAMGTFASPELYAAIDYRTANGTEGTVTRSVGSTAEDYAFLDYFDDGTEKNDWTFPGCFVAAVYDAVQDSVSFTADPDSELAPGAFLISVTVNGESIPEENCSVERVADSFEYDGETFTMYTFYFVMRRPDSFPQHGTAHILIRQRLLFFEHTRVMEFDLDY